MDSGSSAQASSLAARAVDRDPRARSCGHRRLLRHHPDRTGRDHRGGSRGRPRRWAPPRKRSRRTGLGTRQSRCPSPAPPRPSAAPIWARGSMRMRSRQAALETHPMWQVGGWFPSPERVAPDVDAAESEAALANAFAADWVDPVDAVVAFDPATGSYVVAPRGAGSRPRPRRDRAGLRSSAARLLRSSPRPSTASSSRSRRAITTDAATARVEQLQRHGRVGRLLHRRGAHRSDRR